MAEADAPVVPSLEAAPPPRRRWARILLLLLAGLLGVLLATVAVLDTGLGHRLIARRIGDIRPPTGLRIHVGAIEGSIWRRAVLRDVRLYDLRGQFFAAPELRLDWHPLRFLHNRLDVNALDADTVVLARLPKLHSRPNAPLLPSFDLHVGRLEITHLRLGPTLAGGTAGELHLRLGAEVVHHRARIALAVTSPRGDRATLDLDAAPDERRFRLAADAASPAGGVIGGLVGTRNPLTLRVGGRGDWMRWTGQARATLAGREVATLALEQAQGRYRLNGALTVAPFVTGKLQRLSTPRLAVAGEATLVDRRVAGRLQLASPALRLAAAGTLDLARSAFAGTTLDARLLHPPALFPNMTGEDVHLHLTLDGPFRTARYTYALASPHVAFDTTGFEALRAVGAGRLSPAPVTVPIRLSAARVTGLGDVAGGILANVAIAGTFHVDARTLVGDGLALSSDKLKGRLGLHLDLVTGRYAIALAGGLQRYLIPGLGIVDVDSSLSAAPGANGLGTVVSGRGKAAVRRFDNAFLAGLAGGLPVIDTQLVRDADGVLRFPDLVLTGPAIRIRGSGLRRRDGSFQFEGSGTQATYGPFKLQLDGQIDHPQVRLQLDHPVDALGLAAVRLELDPVPEGFVFRAAGRSTLGPFAARGMIRTPAGAPTVIEVADLAVTGTHAKGALRTDAGGFTGRLEVAGGGIAGTLAFAPQGTIQRIVPTLAFSAATLAAPTPIAIRRGQLDGTILLDPAGTVIDGKFSGQAVRRGGVMFGRVATQATLKGGTGTVTASVASAGRRAFELKGQALLAPARVTVSVGGTVAGRPLQLASPATFTAEGASWHLLPVRADYGGGSVTLAGRFGGGQLEVEAGMDRMPLAVLDVAAPSLGLSGAASGKLSFAGGGGRLPSGRVDLTVRGLSRSGLVRSSQPIDLALAGVLTPSGLGARAVAIADGRTVGRAQARIAPLAPGDDWAARLTAAPLFAQLRYTGPGDALWRLTGIETIDLSGPLSVSADIGGTLDRPAIRGALRTDAGRIESAVTGTVIEHVAASGRFDGSRLVLDSMSGATPGGGTVTGHGSFDFAAAHGVGLDLALQANGAQLLNRDDIGATVSGPITIRSDGAGGRIGGAVQLDRARYRLGAAAAAQVARLPVTEINQPDEVETDDVAPTPWTLDLTARARNRLTVTGLGLNSEWRADLTLRGSVDDPAIGGSATLVQGRYEFAGRRFDIDRGAIRFSGAAPPDPGLDISARADIQGLNASIHVTGTGLRPEISFESVPALPEDELLARLLFGTSVANLSAPEALQLASAVASLRQGGPGSGFNLDPINAVRRVVHLDRLRIVPADVTTGQKTAVAAGKYIGRRTYVEVITDGAGYSATSLEYRLTRWLSLLSTVSTIGRQSANVRISKDY